MKHRADQLRAAAALAKERFSAAQAAFDAMESAHKRGDYSPSPDLHLRLDEFRYAASEVQRLTAEFLSAAPSREPGGSDVEAKAGTSLASRRRPAE